jgi:catechol 2,3-dioxygenase-like lactoylglutathione lyase family enzyme
VKIIRGITHVELAVTDLDRSLRFYRDLLGLREVGEPMQIAVPKGIQPREGGTGDCVDGIYEFPGRTMRVAVLRYADVPPGPFKLGYEPTAIVLLQPIDPPPSGKSIKVDQLGISHIAFLVDGPVEAIEARLAKAGTTIRGRQKIGTDDHPSASLFVEDPDGILIQLDIIPAS